MGIEQPSVTRLFIRMLVRGMLVLVDRTRRTAPPEVAAGGRGRYRVELDGMTVFL